MGMQPDEQGIFFVLIVQGGPGSGEFIYDANGNLRSSNVGQATTDPVQGISVPQGFATFNGFGAVINLLGTTSAAAGFFQYFDNKSAVQGALILSVASTAGTDPVVGTAYGAGLTGIDPVAADTLNAIGSVLSFNIAGLFTQVGRINVQQGGGAVQPALFLLAPERGVSGHLAMLMAGTSPDGTKPGQLLIASEATGFTVPAPVSTALFELQGDAAHSPAQLIQSALATDAALATKAIGDTSNEYNLNANGQMSWGPGNAARDIFMSRQAAGILQLTSADFDIATIGKGLRIKEGANARMGTAVLVAGTVTVANTTITAATRIFLTTQVAGGTIGFLRVAGRSVGVNFIITSSSATDTSTVAWLLVEPG